MSQINTAVRPVSLEIAHGEPSFATISLLPSSIILPNSAMKFHDAWSCPLEMVFRTISTLRLYVARFRSMAKESSRNRNVMLLSQ
ncbi:uncharacterized protein PgNI_08933, partial [Pyricularia grisea]|uniref:Uncharacterized protein n=1 Tax=Pyricularia grisea TaxID=148305 RepID=A0A6P8AVS4_PYRGI